MRIGYQMEGLDTNGRSGLKKATLAPGGYKGCLAVWRWLRWLDEVRR